VAALAVAAAAAVAAAVAASVAAAVAAAVAVAVADNDSREKCNESGVTDARKCAVANVLLGTMYHRSLLEAEKVQQPEKIQQPGK
jgi:hypothetical protein